MTINSSGNFVDADAFPDSMLPAVGTANDRVGAAAFAHLLSTLRPLDLVFVQNDLATTHLAAGYVKSLRERGAALPPIIHYFPVDCAVRPDYSGMLEVADVNVTCTAFGQSATTKAFPNRAVLVIPHGIDTRAFRPLPERAAVRPAVRRALGVAADVTLICSVASNNVRKDLPRTLAAFAEYRATDDRSAVLYLHTRAFANGIDLNAAAAELGLVVGRDVVFPPNYHPLVGIADSAMNELYNACDVCFTTTLGEGWGLPITEAMAAGLPVVAPRHSSLDELGGQGRAVLYDCDERIWVDNSGYRPLATMSKTVAALRRSLSMSDGARAEMVSAALEFARSLDWSLVAPRWLSLVDSVLDRGAAC
ncbi:MAG: glycosyltransferase family 4 protein [Polyangiaceae bacterium]